MQLVYNSLRWSWSVEVAGLWPMHATCMAVLIGRNHLCTAILCAGSASIRRAPELKAQAPHPRTAVPTVCTCGRIWVHQAEHGHSSVLRPGRTVRVRGPRALPFLHPMRTPLAQDGIPDAAMQLNSARRPTATRSGRPHLGGACHDQQRQQHTSSSCPHDSQRQPACGPSHKPRAAHGGASHRPALAERKW